MKLKVKTRGFNSMSSVVAYMAKLGSNKAGVSLVANMRDKGGMNNAQVIEHLKTGGRDIKLTQQDTQRLAIIIRDRFMERMRVLSAKTKSFKDTKAGQKAAIIAGRKMANAASASALMQAGREAKKIMLNRVEDSRDNNDQSAKSVTAEYAKQRSKLYGVPEDINQVFKASGQLLNNLSAGHLKLSNFKK